ncbi:recombinase family protein [Frankia sp. CNm7]|uniref:Recombinase family protein n=1 Tax=Frankia nepalensis TaxID=1836974 RepID=A0A937RAP1_9ACTN|nr:recombinase family protein [Frankia nepalensis]MBL7496141.1 recombinase family protein [Frankia nepalensis]MBL7508920.1 recombinase family protein [Frankia nepalensis]MBL7516760.1 recombinase family protein [Frankia nepalensis]MBL7628698.1 recombinase family protein [Frankia nepalensis]
MSTATATPRPAVGYVCVPHADEDRINGLDGQLTAHAQRTGLDLIEVFVDRDTTTNQSDRPGLALAVDTIALHPDTLLLIPDLSHLPTTPASGAEVDERFTTVVHEIRTVNPNGTGPSAEADAPPRPSRHHRAGRAEPG